MCSEAKCITASVLSIASPDSSLLYAKLYFSLIARGRARGRSQVVLKAIQRHVLNAAQGVH